MAKEMTFGHPMFAESMLETSWSQRSRRGWTTLTSFGVQAIVIGGVILMALLRSVVIPDARVVSTPVTMGRPEPEPIAQRPRGGSSAGTLSSTNTIRLMQPPSVPHFVDMSGNDASSQLPGVPDGGVVGSGIQGSGEGLPISLFSGTRPVMPEPPKPVVRQFRPSSLLEGSLIRRVQPVYPYPAKMAHVQGAVILSAIIDKSGSIENLRVLSGHPLLVGAAVEAVSQWRYRPYILNSEPIEVETQITVKFTLSGE